MTELLPVTCPTCFETFEVAAPDCSETPCEVDYDCEICCRPMTIRFEMEAGDLCAIAMGLDE